MLTAAPAGDGHALLVQQHLAGRTLDRLDAAEVDDRLLVAVWAQVGGLRAAGIAHRDLRRSNVLVDPEGRPWLLDFGFAEAAASRRGLAGDVAELLASLAFLVGAVTIALALVLAPGALRDLPLSMLAAIVISAAAGLIDLAAVRRLFRVRRSEFVLWLAAFAGVALLGVLLGIFVAIVLSLADFVRRAWRPYDAVLGREDALKGYHDLDRHPSARRIPGLLLYRFDAPLFFANAGYFRRRIRSLVDEATHPVGWVVVAAEPITDIDTTAADTLRQLLAELRQEQVTLAFAELKGPVKDRLRRYDLFDAVGADQFFPTIGTAVDGYLAATGTTWVDWEERPPAPPKQLDRREGERLEQPEQLEPS